jgi:pimeloyl-ACP methyl ester carboxylesterase
MAARRPAPLAGALLAASAVALVAACGGPAGPITPGTTARSPTATVAGPTSLPSPGATARPTVDFPEIRLQGNLELADGREIAALCVGSGTPTILLEVGGSNDMADWPAQFLRSLGRATTTCLYSRAGGNGSDPPAVRPPTMASVTSDAFEVVELAKAMAGVEGPYVFVGWSLGGSVALADALARPDQTVGVVILDTDFPTDFMAACKANGDSLEFCRSEYDGDIDAKFMETEIAHAVHPLDVPAVLVTAMDYPDCRDSPAATLSANIAGTTVVGADCAGLAAAIADKQIADWAAALPEIEQTRVDADHDGLIVSEGNAIAELILQIVEDARS